MPTGLKYYPATSSQSLYDVCLATYGTLNLLSKLMKDNGVLTTAYRPENGQRFVYDPELVTDQVVEAVGYKYTTAADKPVSNSRRYIASKSDYDPASPGYMPFVNSKNDSKHYVTNG